MKVMIVLLNQLFKIILYILLFSFIIYQKKQQLSSATNITDQQSESAPPTKIQLITPPRSQVIIENPVQTQTEYPIPPELFNSYLTVYWN